MNDHDDAPDQQPIAPVPVLSNADIVSRILGFTGLFAGLGAVHAARSRGWLDAEGGPTEDGRALIAALMRRDAAYGIYRLMT